MSNFTDKQLEAINKDGNNIIVSAGAGSGKTTVLTARVIRKVSEGIDINRLLILTFTNEAALNMKNKIRKELVSHNMTDAIKLLDETYITTFDSYALSIVKKYHYLLNIDSDVNIVESSIIDMKRKEFLDEIFESLYGNNSFDSFISKFTFKDDDTLKKSILRINSLLDLKYDKSAYLNDYINTYYSESIINNLINEYIRYVFQKKDEFLKKLKDFSIIDNNYANEILSLYDGIINASSYDDIKIIGIIKMPSVPKGSCDQLKAAKKELTKVKDELKELVTDDIDTLKNRLLETKEYVNIIIDIIKKLDKKIIDYKEKHNNYEFTDIAKMAIKIVSEFDEVKNYLKNFYNEIMIDEYQDTNDLQEMFIKTIQNNNLYMVGDIKQSIYRFRNANPNIFKEKFDNYSLNKDGYKIDLLDNFRSRKEVVKNINSIFDYIMDDILGNASYKINHRMIYGNKSYDIKANQNYNLEIYNYEYDKEFREEEIEAFIVANDIKKKINNKYKILDNGNLRDIKYSDICIIMDRNTSFDTYKKIFEYMHIPLTMYADKTLNEEKDMYVIKNIINLIIKIHNNDYGKEFKYFFTSIARSYLFKYSDSFIYEIFLNNKFKDTKIYKLCSDISKNLDIISNEVLVKTIINDFNLYENMIKIGDIKNGMARIDYIITLASSLSNLGYTPYDFSNYLNNIDDIEIKYSTLEEANDTVRIMNIHKSKGLEFNICYFTGLYKDFNISELNEQFLYSNKYGIITPYFSDGIDNTFVKTLCKNNYMIDEISEKIRLFYVALTRCKEKMIFVCSLPKNELDIGNMVPLDIRMNYRSFLDIINSIKSKLIDYIVDIDYHKLEITNDYSLTKNSNYKKIDKTTKIINREIKIDKEELIEKHFSKVNHKLYTKEEILKMEYGTYTHHLFEMIDFKKPLPNVKDIEKVANFIKKVDIENAKIYKEYEFYFIDTEAHHGVIDLILEYDNRIDIYDYKLKNIKDEEYIKQLNGYKLYLENKTNKKVNAYLYSIYDEIIEKVSN